MRRGEAGKDLGDGRGAVVGGDLGVAGHGRLHSSNWILRSRARAVHRATSALMYSPNSCGLMGMGTTASVDSLSTMSGAPIVAFSVSFRCLTTAGGMPAGPTTPYHCTASKPLKPDSMSVGTSFTVGWRVVPVMASGF